MRKGSTGAAQERILAQVSENQIKALIRLLGDDDERIVKTISARILS